MNTAAAPPPAERRSFARRALFYLIYIVFIGALLEGGAYVVLKLWDNELGDTSERHRYNPVRGHELNPEYRRTFDTGGQKIHSEQGFRRDTLVERRKPDDTFRIIMMGGSTMYGIGVQSDAFYPLHATLGNDETVSHHLETMLSEALPEDARFKRVEVINAGVTAYHTFQHVIYLYESLYEYSPDLVVFLDGHNDFYTTDTRSPIRRYGYSSMNLIRALNDREPFVTLHVVARLFGTYSHFFKVLEKASYRLFERYEGRPHNIPEGTVAPGDDYAQALEQAAKLGFLRNYELVAALARVHDFKFHVFLQPEVVFEDANLLSDADRQIKKTTETLFAPGSKDSMGTARPLFSQLFAQAAMPFTDIGTIASDATRSQQLYIDYCHLTSAGSQTVAARMLPVVKQYLSEAARQP